MKTYIGVKIVQAEPGVETKESNPQAGYRVFYPDG